MCIYLHVHITHKTQFLKIHKYKCKKYDLRFYKSLKIREANSDNDEFRLRRKRARRSQPQKAAAAAERQQQHQQIE